MATARYLPHYTITDFQSWEGDWELWDRVPVSMSPPPRLPHQRAAFKLAHLLENALERETKCRCMVVHETDWHIADHTVVRPDVSVLCNTPLGDWITAPPNLVAEFLSPATREKDLTAKRDLYAQQGVPFYIIGDPDSQELTILKLQADGTYSESDTPTLDLHEDCRVELETSKVFPSATDPG